MWSKNLAVPVGHCYEGNLGQASVPVHQPGGHGDVVGIPQVVAGDPLHIDGLARENDPLRHRVLDGGIATTR